MYPPGRVYIYMHKHMHICTHTHTHNTHRYICTYNHICTQMCMHRCAHTNVHARMSRSYTYMHTYIYINILYTYIKVYGIHKLIHKYPGGSRTARAFSFQNPGHSGHTVFSNTKCVLPFFAAFQQRSILPGCTLSTPSRPQLTLQPKYP